MNKAEAGYFRSLLAWRFQYLVALAVLVVACDPGLNLLLPARLALAAFALCFALILRLPMWVTPRFLYALGGIALLASLAPGVSVFWPIAELAFAGLIVATLVDAFIGPRARELTVERKPIDHVSLRVPLEIAYVASNRSQRAVRVAIVETPVRTLRYELDEAIGDVPARSRATILRPSMPVSRGEDSFGALYVWFENTLGLLRRRIRVEADATFRVYPDLSGGRALRRAARTQSSHRSRPA